MVKLLYSHFRIITAFIEDVDFFIFLPYLCMYTFQTKELKSLCRGGIPDRYRKQMWRHLVHHHVKDLMLEKGDYYYRNLCNMLPESPVSCLQPQHDKTNKDTFVPSKDLDQPVHMPV